MVLQIKEMPLLEKQISIMKEDKKYLETELERVKRELISFRDGEKHRKLLHDDYCKIGIALTSHIFVW